MWTRARCQALRIEGEKYTLIQDQLYKRGPDDQLRLCAHETEYIPLLEQAHGSIAGDHFFAERTVKIILNAGNWWPTLHQDVEEFVKRCDDCQRTKVPIKKAEMPLRPMMGARAFSGG